MSGEKIIINQWEVSWVHFCCLTWGSLDQRKTVWRKQFAFWRRLPQENVLHCLLWTSLAGWGNDAGASMLLPVSSHSVCLPSLCAHWRCFSLTPAAHFHFQVKVGCVTTPVTWQHILLNPCGSGLLGYALKHRREVWTKQVFSELSWRWWVVNP